jgi:hypothetical protein
MKKILDIHQVLTLEWNVLPGSCIDTWVLIGIYSSAWP